MQDLERDKHVQHLNDKISDILNTYRTSCELSSKNNSLPTKDKELYIQYQTDMTKSCIISAFLDFSKAATSLNAKLN